MPNLVIDLGILSKVRPALGYGGKALQGLGALTGAYQIFDLLTPDKKDKFPVGYRATLGGDPVFWAGQNYGFQTPASYRRIFGAYPAGYSPSSVPGATPDQAQRGGGIQVPPVTQNLPMPGSSQSTTGQPSTTGQAPSTTQPGTSTTVNPAAAIPLSSDQAISKGLERLSAITSPEFITELNRQKTLSTLVSSALTSQLRGGREQERQRAEIELENIKAWRDKEVAAYNANAARDVAMGSAIVGALSPSAMTPLLTAYNTAYQSALTPFTGRG